MNTRARRLAQQWRNVQRAIALVWAAARSWTLAWAAVLVIQGLIPIATVYLTRALVNDLVVAIRTGGSWANVRPAVVVAAWMGACLVATEVLKSAAAWIRTAQSELVRDHITGLIHAKAASVDLAYYESADFYDRLHRASTEARHRPLGVLENFGSLIQNGITLVAMGAILLPFGPILPLTLLISTLPAMYVVVRTGLTRHQFAKTSTVLERRSSYYDWLMTSADSAAELRSFGLAGHFQSAYNSLRGRLRNDRLALVRRQGLAELGAGLSTLTASGAAMVWMVWRAVRGLITAGDLALFYQAYNQGLALFRTFLQNVGQLYENTLFLDNLFEFLELQPTIVNPAAPVPMPFSFTKDICFDNVSFRYPNSDRLALKNFSLVVNPGQIVAIVGPNGAGKTTVIKLLSRFYDPDAGSITLGGVPLSQISLDELRSCVSVLLQTPNQYEATVAENIGFGNLKNASISAIESAAKDAGADSVIRKLPQGYETQLGKWFMDGTELSVGEWQRIALARTFTRNAPIIILDEPTSAMDPWAEAKWAEGLRELTRGKTVILITHRFTTARFADIIHVVVDGQVAESGTHDELLAEDTRYARAWSSESKPAVYGGVR